MFHFSGLKPGNFLKIEMFKSGGWKWALTFAWKKAFQRQTCQDIKRKVLKR